MSDIAELVQEPSEVFSSLTLIAGNTNDCFNVLDGMESAFGMET
jgi:hypothetical protein